MAAPKGNKYAVGNPNSGRPRIYDYEKEAQDLLDWSAKPDSMSLYEFTDEKPYLAEELAVFASRCEVFASALKKSKERIAKRREKLAADGKLYFGVYNLQARVYDSMLRQRQDEDADADAERKKKSAPTNNIYVNTTQELIDQNPNASKDLVNEANS